MPTESLPDFSFRTDAHDRLSERRSDAEFLERAWQDPTTRVVVVHGVEVRVGTDCRLATVGTHQAPPGERMLLGSAYDAVHFLVLEPSEESGDEGADGAGAAPDLSGFRSLRAVARGLPAVDASLAVHAVALAQWHRRHSRCAVCGGETRVTLAGESRNCEACGTEHFPRTDPAVIMLITDDADRCLLANNAARSAEYYSTLAGFVEPGEALEDAVRREVREETGVVVDSVEYLGSQPWPFPSSLMLGFRGHAATTELHADGVEIKTVRWFTRDELRAAVEAGRIIVSTTVSISGALLQDWYGAPLPTVGART